MVDWSDLSVLVTGGTGSFGQTFVRIMLKDFAPRRLVIFSRDELKQEEMRRQGLDDPRLRYFIGDVRDLGRLQRAMEGVDIVLHAAAMKQVPACEYNPIEAVRTNVEGTRNVIDAALDHGVKRVMAISTDKAVNPINLYGATKLVAEKLIVQANSYSGSGPTRFSCVRYGNVVGSRGSILPLLLEQKKRGIVTVTDPRMTRFWLTLDQGVRFTISCIERMHGGEVFVPKIPSLEVMALVSSIAPSAEIQFIGIRPGEKVNETLISEDESRHTIELEDMFIIKPTHSWWNPDAWKEGRPLPDGYRFASNENAQTVPEAVINHWVDQATRTYLRR